MKTFTLILCLLAACVVSVRAQIASAATSPSQSSNGKVSLPPPTTPQVVERGANYKLWQRTVYEAGPSGQVVPRIHKIKELASGMHFLNAQGQWVESKNLIASAANGAVAQQGPYQVSYANNLNSAGAIDQQTPDGKRLRSNILGLAYYDTASGQSVLIGQIQDSQGEMLSANQVLYPNAFSGVNADVRYTYKKGSFEQDIILRAQLPTPESVGLSSATTEIEVMTEFLSPPQETVINHPGKNGEQLDQDVSWGTMRLGRGKVFDLGEAKSPKNHVSVYRQYGTINGRKILLEIVPLKNIVAQLQNLPLQSSLNPQLPKIATKDFNLPRTPKESTDAKPMKLAVKALPQKGFVLDYIELNTDQSNFTFQGDTTYLVDGEFNCTGNTIFEGGTVIKADVNGQIDIDAGGTITCQSTAYHPAVFTSVSDDSVGETGGDTGDPYYTGTPEPGDIYTMLNLNGPNVTVHDLRFNYCTIALNQNPVSMVDIWDCQFLNIDSVLVGWSAGLHNCLVNRTSVSGIDAVMQMYGDTVLAENVTVDDGGGVYFTIFENGSGTLAITNCIITGENINDGTATSVFTNTTAWIHSPTTPIYQSAGSGNYYLTNGSPFQNAGTTNISPLLLAELAQKTTYPPVIYAGVTLTTNATFYPQVQRDNVGNPSMGYHYDALDYIFGSVTVNSNLTFAAGTDVGWYEDASVTGSGLNLPTGITVAFNGTATAPCIFTRFNTVQEGNGTWTSPGWVGLASVGPTYFVTNGPVINAHFTFFSQVEDEQNYFRDFNSPIVFRANSVEYHSGSSGGYGMELYLTNCLIDRAFLAVQAGSGSPTAPVVSALCMRNCTMHGSYILTTHWDTAVWPTWIENCVFDDTDLSPMDNPAAGNTNITYCNFNAFLTNAIRLPVLGANDVTYVPGFNWQSSWLGSYYLPADSPLINAGSTTANLVGLYQFTTQTNQIKEAFSYVDIGYHYVAIDANTGEPYSTYSNGIPDYIADADGNGLPDWWEIAYFGQTGVNALADADGDGWSNYQEYLNGTNPVRQDQPANAVVTMPGAGTIVP